MKKITLTPIRKRALIKLVCGGSILLFFMAQSWTLLLATFGILAAHIFFFLFGNDASFTPINQRQKPFQDSLQSHRKNVNDPTFNGLGTLYSRQRDLGF